MSKNLPLVFVVISGIYYFLIFLVCSFEFPLFYRIPLHCDYFDVKLLMQNNKFFVIFLETFFFSVNVECELNALGYRQS